MDFSSYDIKNLQLLYTIAEENVKDFTAQMEKEEDLKSEKFKELAGYLLNSSAWAEQVLAEIQKRQKEKLNFSVEDLFCQAGQYDKFVSVEFYRNSDAFGKYGESVNGKIIYGRKQRNDLTQRISVEDHERTDGVVLLNSSSKNQAVNKQLKTEGFLASDISSILTFLGDPNEVVYQKPGIKEIPNTIVIPFESDSFDLPKTQNLITSWKFRDKTKILDHELIRYYTNELIMGEEVPEAIKLKFLYEDSGPGLKEDVLIHFYSYGYEKQLLDQQQKNHLNKLFKSRADRREELLKRDLSISNKRFEKFKLDFPDAYRQTRGAFLAFTNETLSEHKTQHPVYWDEERFVHIYGRHYVDHFINMSTYNGTHFQYSFKDIRRLLCMVLESLQGEIEAALSSGKNYNKYGDQGYYFNGNYYTLKIDANGRLMTFFPMS
ncbi:hypothetical protein [Pedobacter nyackensis]|uniref:hypothetical protein n=1 Tax=Pedobacter nyackensis TaxID=475255 RepID=UPI00292E8616|nr:hypothetical protein [Pedobacter nyackensis]